MHLRKMVLPIIIDQAWFRTGQDWLLSDISLSIEENSFLAIVGHNGAGKTLLLRLISGLLTPTKGGITWNGQPLTRHQRLEIGMVFQSPRLLNRSVRAVLRHSVAHLARGEIQRQVEWALSAGHFEHVCDRPTNLLSGGELRRLAIVRALMRCPRLLLLDEPYAHLDPQNMRKILNLIQDFSQKNKAAIIMVSHESDLSFFLADRVALMEYGSILALGSVKNVRNHEAYKRYTMTNVLEEKQRCQEKS